MGATTTFDAESTETSDPDRIVEVHAAVDALSRAALDRCGHHELDTLAGAAQRLRGFVAAAEVRLARRRDALWSGSGDPNELGPCTGGHGDASPGSAGTSDPADTDAGRPDPGLGGSGGPIPDGAGAFDRFGDRRPGREAERDRARARAGTRFPTVEAAVGAGEIDAAHLDALVNALSLLADEPDAMATFCRHEARLLEMARCEDPVRFRRRCTDLARRCLTDHGVALAERRRRQASVRRWWDRRSGMWHLHALLDPETAARVEGALDAHLDVVRARESDSSTTMQRLQVDAFAELVAQSSLVDARTAEVIVLVDLDTLRSGILGRDGVCETSAGADLSPETARRLACDARLLPAVLGGDGVQLDLGRARRLASRDQRRALRTLHQTCAHPSCDVPIDRCRIHHVTAWEHLGPSDLSNLVPLCGRHHHLVHEGGWTLTMTEDRVAIWRTPDGTVWSVADVRDRPSPRWPVDPLADPDMDTVSTSSAATANADPGTAGHAAIGVARGRSPSEDPTVRCRTRTPGPGP